MGTEQFIPLLHQPSLGLLRLMRFAIRLNMFEVHLMWSYLFECFVSCLADNTVCNRSTELCYKSRWESNEKPHRYLKKNAMILIKWWLFALNWLFVCACLFSMFLQFSCSKSQSIGYLNTAKYHFWFILMLTWSEWYFTAKIYSLSRGIYRSHFIEPNENYSCISHHLLR